VFFAELSNILSKGLRHVIAPPSATWHHQVSPEIINTAVPLSPQAV
jgi:hypothetical protein